jgi:hypothetical protein
MSILCAPMLFHSLNLAERSSATLRGLVKDVPTILGLVKCIRLTVDIRQGDTGSDQLLAQIVGHSPALRQITLLHREQENVDLPLFITALSNLSSLEDLRLVDQGYRVGIRCGGPSNFFQGRCLNTILDSHGSKLRSLSLFGDRFFTEETFAKIRDKAGLLQRFRIVQGISVGLRDALACTSTWACAPYLQHIELHRCGGVHAAIFTHQLAAGIFGHPKSLYLSMCGAVSDDVTRPIATKWTIPRLEIVQFEYFAEWEMRHFAIIHTKKAFLSSVWRHALNGEYARTVEALSDPRTFPTLEKVHMSYHWEGDMLRDLTRVCLERGIREVMNDWSPWGTGPSQNW